MVKVYMYDFYVYELLWENQILRKIYDVYFFFWGNISCVVYICYCYNKIFDIYNLRGLF